MASDEVVHVLNKEKTATLCSDADLTDLCDGRPVCEDCETALSARINEQAVRDLQELIDFMLEQPLSAYGDKVGLLEAYWAQSPRWSRTKEAG